MSTSSPSGQSSDLLGRNDSALVGRLRSLVGAHGGSGVAVINNLGRAGARIVVVTGDGVWGDVVASSAAAAAAICEQAGVPVAEGWDREMSGRMVVSPADRRRMAGTGR